MYSLRYRHTHYAMPHLGCENPERFFMHDKGCMAIRLCNVCAQLAVLVIHLVLRLVHKQLELLVPLGVQVVVDHLAARHPRRAHSQPAQLKPFMLVIRITNFIVLTLEHIPLIWQ